MIIHIKEWCDYDFDDYYLDIEKLDTSIPYEAKFLEIIKLALNQPDKSLALTRLEILSIEKHFGSKETSNMSKRACVNLPNIINDSITLYF